MFSFIVIKYLRNLSKLVPDHCLVHCHHHLPPDNLCKHFCQQEMHLWFSLLHMKGSLVWFFSPNVHAPTMWTADMQHIEIIIIME